MKAILAFYDRGVEALKKGASVDALVSLPVREGIGRLKYAAEDRVEEEYSSLLSRLDSEITEALQHADEDR